MPRFIPASEPANGKPTTAMTLHVSPGTVHLPDNGQWTNRFEIHSSSSSRIYIIAQNIKKRFWACSCPGWISKRKCKHLENLGLPCFEVPKEVKLVK